MGVVSEHEPPEPDDRPAWELDPDLLPRSTELAEGESVLIFIATSPKPKPKLPPAG
jgi:hypothetical protein